jgi:hypothetical protein
VSELYGDVMGDLRTWVRSVTSDLLDGRVFFNFPTKMAYPACRMYEAGGGPDGGEAPVENIRVVFDIWGQPARAVPGTGGTYADVTAIVRRLKTQLHTLQGLIGSGSTYVLNADVTSVVPSNDPDAGNVRRLVTALITVIAPTA